MKLLMADDRLEKSAKKLENQGLLSYIINRIRWEPSRIYYAEKLEGKFGMILSKFAHSFDERKFSKS